MNNDAFGNRNRSKFRYTFSRKIEALGFFLQDIGETTLKFSSFILSRYLACKTFAKLCNFANALSVVIEPYRILDLRAVTRSVHVRRTCMEMRRERGRMEPTRGTYASRYAIITTT